VSFYDEADLDTAMRAWVLSNADQRGSVRRAINAVAPAIAARALREAAEAARGGATKASDRVWLGFLDRRADEIDGGAR
jgi:hypothetical protein